ncbi:MAG: hypothetical protein KKB31_05015 [Nanoarchaeota archaeon]|nr:hypothetical protein [Nanoarchaeota archaeon]
MPKAQLLCLINLDFEELFRIERKIRKEWIEKEKCGCVNDERIGRSKVVLMCQHIDLEIKNKTKKIRKKIKEKSNILLLRNLSSFPRVNKIFDRR